MGDPGGGEEGGGHQGANRVPRADLVLDELVRHGTAQLFGNQRGGILLHRSAREGTAIRRPEAQRSGLLAAAAADRGQATGQVLEIEPGYGQRC
jgi:hypothetical protein